MTAPGLRTCVAGRGFPEADRLLAESLCSPRTQASWRRPPAHRVRRPWSGCDASPHGLPQGSQPNGVRGRPRTPRRPCAARPQARGETGVHPRGGADPRVAPCPARLGERALARPRGGAGVGHDVKNALVVRVHVHVCDGAVPMRALGEFIADERRSLAVSVEPKLGLVDSGERFRAVPTAFIAHRQGQKWCALLRQGQAFVCCGLDDEKSSATVGGFERLISQVGQDTLQGRVDAPDEGVDLRAQRACIHSPSR